MTILRRSGNHIVDHSETMSNMIDIYTVVMRDDRLDYQQKTDNIDSLDRFRSGRNAPTELLSRAVSP